jgi:hypothetical protein
VTHGILSPTITWNSKLTNVSNVLKINHLDITNYDFIVIFYDVTI